MVTLSTRTYAVEMPTQVQTQSTRTVTNYGPDGVSTTQTVYSNQPGVVLNPGMIGFPQPSLIGPLTTPVPITTNVAMQGMPAMIPTTTITKTIPTATTAFPTPIIVGSRPVMQHSHLGAGAPTGFETTTIGPGGVTSIHRESTQTYSTSMGPNMRLI